MIGYISPKSKKLLIEKQHCLETDSGESFPVIDGIPRFVTVQNYASAFGIQWKTFSKTQLDSLNNLSISKQRLESALGDSLQTLKDKNVLEAGCGAGRFTELLVASGANTHSFDLSAAVDANKENTGEQKNYKVAQASIYDIPYPDEAFDFVICLGVIQHTPSPERTIEHLWKKVKPGGSLVIDHYRLNFSYFFKLKPLWRFFLKRMNPEKAMGIVRQLHRFFFPFHWKLRNHTLLRKLLYRISPLTDHLDDFPALEFKTQSEWSLLDSYDSLTDYYKHLRTLKQIRKILESLGPKKIFIRRGGTGIEARAEK